MEYHRNQTVNFKAHAFPLSGAAVPFLLKSRYLGLNIGDLFEYVASKLWDMTAVRTNPTDFTLVNVTSPFSGFSHGANGPPPLNVRPKGPALILTFALTSSSIYTEQDVYRSQDVRRLSINSTQWGTGMKPEFASISVGTEDSHDLGLLNLQANQLQYLYNLLGSMTKNLILHQRRYNNDSNSYTELHGSYSLYALHRKVARMPIPLLFQQVPYPLWAFSEILWEMAPNVIPQRCVTPELALYYFMYLVPSVSIWPSIAGDVKLKRLGLGTYSGTGISGHLSDSLLNFIQMIKTPGDADLEVPEVLAPAVLQALMLTSKCEIVDNGPNYLRTLGLDAQAFAQSLSNTAESDKLAALLMPTDAVAVRVLEEDRLYADTLLNAVTLIQNRDNTREM